MSVSFEDMARRLYEEHAAYVQTVAYLLTQSKSLTEDIVQETFIRVFRGYASYEQNRPIRPWIYQITLNVTRSMLRKRRAITLFDSPPDMADSDPGPLHLVLQRETNRELWEAMGRISLKSREILVLKYFMGMSVDEIAEHLSIPVNTCKSRIHFALLQMRKQFAEMREEEISRGEH